MINEDRLEAAARELCIIRGFNPEERASYRIPNDNRCITTYRPLWKNVAEEIKLQIDKMKIISLIHKHQLIVGFV